MHMYPDNSESIAYTRARNKVSINQIKAGTRIIERKCHIVYKETKIPTTLTFATHRERQSDLKVIINKHLQSIVLKSKERGVIVNVPRFKLYFLQNQEGLIKQVIVEPYNASYYDSLGNLDTSPSFMHQDSCKTIFDSETQKHKSLQKTANIFFNSFREISLNHSRIVFDFLGINNLIFNVNNPNVVILTNSCCLNLDGNNTIINQDSIKLTISSLEANSTILLSRDELIRIEYDVRMFACLAYRTETLFQICSVDSLYDSEIIEQCFSWAEKLRLEISNIV
jgi:hypothetical protein